MNLDHTVRLNDDKSARKLEAGQKVSEGDIFWRCALPFAQAENIAVAHSPDRSCPFSPSTLFSFPQRVELNGHATRRVRSVRQC